jgi:hypothetical protein
MDVGIILADFEERISCALRYHQSIQAGAAVDIDRLASHIAGVG